MAVPRFDYVERPFYAPRATSDTTRLQQIYGLGGQAVAALSLQRGQAQAETMQRLAQIISGGIGTVREGRNRAETIAIRATEREADRLEKEKDRKAREAEIKAAKDERAAEKEFDAAQHTVDRAAPGPVSPSMLALVKKFPALAAQFRVQTDLPATVTPGALGEVAPVGEAYGVKEPTADQMEAAGDRQFRREQATVAEAARVRDDARADTTEARTGRFQDESLKIARENAATSRLNAETTRQRYTGGGVDTTKLGPLANVLDRAILTIQPSKRAPILALAHRYADEGNEKALKEIIQQAAIENEPVGTKDAIRARRSTIAALNDAQVVMQEMKKAGVPSNILSGTAEDIARKLGTSTDPRYVEFATQLQDTLINYRRAATGAAFGEKEGADYARMFPNYRQTMPVNEATIKGLKRSMETTDREYWRGKLGEDGMKSIFGDPKVSTQPASDNDVDALIEKYGRKP